MTGVLIRRWKFGHSDTQREDSHVTMETVMEVVWPHTKEYQESLQPLVAGGSVGDSPQSLQGAQPC